MKKSEAISKIMDLKGVQKVQTIIDIIMSIENFKKDTLNKLTPTDDYSEGICFSDLYVNLTYQRKLKIQTLINRLCERGYFDKEAAGYIDIAVRRDGRNFVWDGFHRCIMAALVGCTKMPYSEFKHGKDVDDDAATIKEAQLFEMRNGYSSPVSPGELFKAQVSGNRAEALRILKVLKSCKLDVEGTNPDVDTYDLGGFAFFRKHWESVDERHLIDASDMIKQTWPKVKTCSVMLLIGLAALLDANDNEVSVKSVSLTEIREKLKEIVGTGADSKNQSYFTEKRLQGKSAQSIARNLLRYGVEDLYNDDGEEVSSLLKKLQINEDDEELLDTL